jgi:4-hydroxy-tetrahydrodipicolinate reductase
MNKKITVCLAGATGWAGSALARAIATAPDVELVAAVSRSHAGQPLGNVIEAEGLSVPIVQSVKEGLNSRPDVLVEYTHPDSAKAHVLAALEAGAQVVVGTSGLNDADYAEINRVAIERGRGVLACGNFALGAVLLQRFASMAAKHIPHWEIIDYAHADKVDVPSGTVLELTDRLSKIAESTLEVPLDEVRGPGEARGARLGGSQVHSVRLPGYVISFEAIFGMPDQRLTLRFDSGTSAEPYVAGAMLAIRKVGGLIGLHRGLDSVMEF